MAVRVTYYTGRNKLVPESRVLEADTFDLKEGCLRVFKSVESRPDIIVAVFGPDSWLSAEIESKPRNKRSR